MSNKLNYLDKKGLAKVFSILKFGHKKIWHGTLTEWEALSATEKAKYDQAEVIDEYTGVPVVVDKVESGNLNPVTSNAVSEYIRNQNILSDWEDITVPAAGYTAPYDGFVSVSNAVTTGKTGLAAILVNGVSCNSWGILPTDITVGANTMSCSALVKKGDVVTTIGVDIDATKARFYKLRDYTGR